MLRHATTKDKEIIQLSERNKEIDTKLEKNGKRKKTKKQQIFILVRNEETDYWKGLEMDVYGQQKQ